MTAAEFLELALKVALALMAAAVALGLVRLWKGPTLADRVVALDMMSAAVIGFCALYALAVDVTAFLDIAVVAALIGFVPVVAFARYAMRRAEMEAKND